MSGKSLEPSTRNLILDLPEWYLFVFILSTKRFFPVRGGEALEGLLSDSLHEGLVNMPYLILLRRYLDYFLGLQQCGLDKRNSFRKLLFLLEEYFVNEPVYLARLASSGAERSSARGESLSFAQAAPGLSFKQSHQARRAQSLLPQLQQGFRVPKQHVF